MPVPDRIERTTDHARLPERVRGALASAAGAGGWPGGHAAAGLRPGGTACAGRAQRPAGCPDAPA